MSGQVQIRQSPLSLDIDFSQTMSSLENVDPHMGKGTNIRAQDGFIQELIEHNCKSGKTRADLVIKDVNIKEHHLSRVRKNSSIDEVKNMVESYNQMVENIVDNLTLLVMHNGLQLAELLLILRTRIKPSITISISTIRSSLYQILSPYWWGAEIIGEIIQLVIENVGQENGRIDRLTDEERRLGKSYTEIIQEMRNHYDEHQDRVNRFFYEHTVVCAKLSDGDNIACICYDPRQLDTAANSAVRMRARKALVDFTSDSIEYTIILLNSDDCCEIAKLSHRTASDAKERLQALIGESGYAQGSKKLAGETCSAQQESQREHVMYTCNICPQLGKAMVNGNETKKNSLTDTQIPFLNQFS